MLEQINKIKKFFEGETMEERHYKPYKQVVDNHFGELIDWNVQTSVYSMLCTLIHHIDEKHLKTFAKAYKEHWNQDIEVQLKDAMIDVLKFKGLLNDEIK